MKDMKKESNKAVAEATKAENMQKELSDEQLNDVAGGDLAHQFRVPQAFPMSQKKK